MYTNSLTVTPDLQQELSHGEAMNKEIYRKNQTYLSWFRNLLFGRATQGNKPEDVVRAMGNTANVWFRAAENSASFINSAHQTDGRTEKPVTVLPDGYTYQAQADGTVVLADVKNKPATAGVAAAPIPAPSTAAAPAAVSVAAASNAAAAVAV